MLQFWTQLLLLTFGKKKSRDDFKKVGNHWLLIHKSLWKVHGKQISKWNLLRRISAKKERFVGTSNSLFLFAIFFCLHCAACQILSSLTRDRTCAPAVETQSLDHWATRRVPPALSSGRLSSRHLYHYVRAGCYLM